MSVAYHPACNILAFANMGIGTAMSAASAVLLCPPDRPRRWIVAGWLVAAPVVYLLAFAGFATLVIAVNLV